MNKQRVVITGAAGGIGQALAKLFVQQGATLVLTDAHQEKLETLSTSLDGEHHHIVGDLSQGEFCDSLIDQAAELMGGIDVVVNNAGIIRRGDALTVSTEDWQSSMNINVEAVFRICRGAITQMKQQETGGAIVNVSSCWGLYPGPDHVAYCTSKAAVLALTKCLARDHAKDQIRVNAVCPNEVNTPMLRSGFEIRGLDPDTAIETLNQSVPIGRIAEAQEIAQSIVFLASPEASYICGAHIEINGAKPVY